MKNTEVLKQALRTKTVAVRRISQATARRLIAAGFVIVLK